MILKTLLHPLVIFSQSDYLIWIVALNSHTQWQTVQIQISWLLQKPTDLDLYCLQRQGISGFSRTKVNAHEMWLREMDTLSEEITLSNSTLKKRSSKRREFALEERKFFPFSIDPFLKGLGVQLCKQEVTKVISLVKKKMAENLPSVSSTLKFL